MPKMPKGAVIFGMLQGPVASPGKYQIKLSCGEWSETQELEVRADPRVEITQTQFDEQLEFLLDVGRMIEELAAKLQTLRSARDQVKQAAVRVKDSGAEEETTKQVQEAADDIIEKLTGIENELVQTKSRGFEDPLNYPGKLYAQLANVHSVTNGAFVPVDAPPTDGANEFLGELKGQAGEIYGRLQAILDADVTQFNALVGKLNLPTVIIKKPGS